MIRRNEEIKVLIVDDSAFMRKALSIMLRSEPLIKVIGTACDGIEAVEKVVSLKPDVVTLDIEMPRMDGLTALKHIMADNPLPVIMISSLTKEGAQATFEALELGAADYIPKQLSYVSLDIRNIEQELINKIKTLTRKKFFSSFAKRRSIRREASGHIEIKKAYSPGLWKKKADIVAIGTSTGGPPALQEVLTHLPEDFPVGIVIVQHMPEAFTGPFADRLNRLSKIDVKEAEPGDRLSKGLAIVAHGGRHLVLKKKGTPFVEVDTPEAPADSLHRPSVDVMMLSVADLFKDRIVGVIMTGMGHDGLAGMTAIKTSGGVTIAQDEDSCVVYGMPKAVVDAGLASSVVPLEGIAKEIIKFV